MAFGNITRSPLLMPWYDQGVHHILAHEDLPPELSLCHTQRSIPKTTPAPQAQRQRPEIDQRKNIPANTEVYTKPVAQEHSQTQKHNVPTNPQWQNKVSQNPPSNISATHKEESAPTSLPQGPYRVQGPSFLPPQQWPTPWQERLKATNQGPILWTYGKLGEDFCLGAHAERRSFMHRLLTDLQHPKGTHIFWPPSMPLDMQEMQQGFVANAQVFWSGVHYLNARVVIAMGQGATKAIALPANIRPFMQLRYNGHFVVVVRDVDLLIHEPTRYGSVLEFIRKSLAPYIR